MNDYSSEAVRAIWRPTKTGKAGLWHHWLHGRGRRRSRGHPHMRGNEQNSHTDDRPTRRRWLRVWSAVTLTCLFRVDPQLWFAAFSIGPSNRYAFARDILSNSSISCFWTLNSHENSFHGADDVRCGFGPPRLSFIESTEISRPLFSPLILFVGLDRFAWH